MDPDSGPMVLRSCRVCGGDLDNPTYQVREMHFGTREVFEYKQCAQCRCLQIVQFPSDLAAYCPASYYSMAPGKVSRGAGPMAVLRRVKLNAVLHRRDLTSKALFFIKDPRLPPWLSHRELDSGSRILEVGCGTGDLLLKLNKKGFQHLVGVDPFLEESITYPSGVAIHKKDLRTLAANEGRAGFDVVMMHHSLEHIADQHQTLESVRALLKNGGLLIVRIPISSSWAWENYQENWVQLDAPRHFYLHSRNSIELLAKGHGFELRQVMYDSTEFQFTGSERYQRDIPLNEGNENELFTEAQIEEYRRRAQELNCKEAGDQACFVFQAVREGEAVSVEVSGGAGAGVSLS